ncbi:uncharacterized protein FIBRA_03839 [Fibroporia radiculosa]|uniref:Hydrophobin n=1 Tax=Fibroporia radiculosa TaxID=599839 RepID=J4HW75_9APHY|nr:uncharacterized protein FIBRA_03839 [Fibroporia radiculosa]CCM01772.1 predicted protein [Fibroporia radiculosa]
MISRVLIATSLALLAVATPWNTPTTTATTTVTVTATPPTATTASQCDTSDLQCCQSTENANSVAGSLLLGVLGIVLEDPNVLLGLDCTTLGVGGNCNAQPVCCSDNSAVSLGHYNSEKRVS